MTAALLVLVALLLVLLVVRSVTIERLEAVVVAQRAQLEAYRQALTTLQARVLEADDDRAVGEHGDEPTGRVVVAMGVA